RGFLAAYEEGRDIERYADDAAKKNDDARLPQMEQGDPLATAELAADGHTTAAPPRYTEASLVKALEERGIGRPSTYAPTISTIISRGYVSREQRRLYATTLGRMVTQMMRENFSDIVDVQFTAGVEDKLDAVEEDALPWREVIREFYGPFEQSLEKAEQNIEKVKVADEVSDEVCELCGAPMVYKMGRFGRF